MNAILWRSQNRRGGRVETLAEEQVQSARTCVGSIPQGLPSNQGQGFSLSPQKRRPWISDHNRAARSEKTSELPRGSCVGGHPAQN